ncbi:MAG: DinB family protein [Gemmatimonadota bacterium]
MSIAQSLLGEWDHEVQNTKKMLDAVPDGAEDFKPHEKSLPLGRLASHVAEFDWATFGYKPPSWPGSAKNAASYLEKAAAAREILAATSDEEMMKPWTMRNGDQVFFTMPKVAVLRNFVFNHIVHHRAQLGVYLRMQGVKVPGMYGPSADESM